MNAEAQWLLHFCVENSLLGDAEIVAVCSNAAAVESARACGDFLLQAKLVDESEFIDEAVASAEQNTRDGFDVPGVPGLPAFALGDAEGFDGPPDLVSLATQDDDRLRATMEHLILFCQRIGASDVHVSAGGRLRMRLYRRLVYLTAEPLDAGLARRMNYVLLSEEQRGTFERDMDLDYALHIDREEANPHLRYRSNLSLQAEGVAGVVHLVPSAVQTLEELGFPQAEFIHELLAYHNGLIIIAGPVGSGKTTTLAALVDELNQSRTDHIITVEQPIEIIQESASSIVSQREVGVHTRTFETALKSALREDPDIIVVGEMHNLETIEMALTAAETGHLVVATMHTRDAASTLSRLLDVFPPVQRNQIRATLAGSLRGVVCQRLLPCLEGGVVLASELLINNAAVSNIIRDGKETGIESAMQTGKRVGMRPMNDCVEQLFKEGLISEETRLVNLRNPEETKVQRPA